MEQLQKALLDIARDTVRRCTHIKETDYFGIRKDRPVFLPAGDGKYKSFWPVDAILSARSGLLDPALLKDILDIIFTHGQNGPEPVFLENGLEIPPWAVADHINFDGKPVFFPGTYASGQNQGAGSYGFLPPLNNLYLVTELVDRYIAQSGDVEILDADFVGVQLKDRLKNAFFAAYAIDPETELCRGDEARYTVDWTYCDQVKKSGLFLVPSLMRWEAAGILAKFFPEEAEGFLAIRDRIAENLIKYLFEEGTGWFYSATGKGRQKDVWGTAYAIYSGILPSDIRKKACEALKNAYLAGTATNGGCVRHILTDADAAPGTAWQKCDCPYNSYMNGGYWATPSGWFAYGLYLIDPDLAQQFIEEYIGYITENCRNGAPYEWFHPETGKHSGCFYGTSGTSVYAALQKMKW